MIPRLTEVFFISEIEVEDRTGWTPEHREALKTLAKIWSQVQKAMREMYRDEDLVPRQYRSGIRTQLTIDQLVPTEPYKEINDAVPFYMAEPWSQDELDSFEKDKKSGHYSSDEEMKPNKEKFLVAVGTEEQAKGPPRWSNNENERVINAPDGKKVLVVML